MKGWWIAAILLLGLVLTGAVACNPFGSSGGKANQQLDKVMRGDLTVTVNGIGNIDIPEERELSTPDKRRSRIW